MGVLLLFAGTLHRSDCSRLYEPSDLSFGPFYLDARDNRAFQDRLTKQ